MFASSRKYSYFYFDIIFILKRGGAIQLSDAVQNRIINLCKEQNITLNKLATNSTVFSIFYGKIKSPKLATILHICEGFNIELTDFFNDPLFKDVEFEDE